MSKTETNLIILGIVAILAVIIMVFLYKFVITGDVIYDVRRPPTPGIQPIPGPYLTDQGYIYPRDPKIVPAILEVPGMETMPLPEAQQYIIQERGRYYYSPYLPYQWPKEYEQYPGLAGSPNLPNKQITR